VVGCLSLTVVAGGGDVIGRTVTDVAGRGDVVG